TTAGYNWYSVTSSQSSLVDFIVENGDWEFDRSAPPEGGAATAVKDPKLNGIFLSDGTSTYRYTDLNILARKIRDARYSGGYHFLETKDKQIDPRAELLNVARRTGALDGFEPLQIVKTAVNEIVYAWGWKQWVTTNYWDKNYTEEWVKGDLLVDVSPMTEDSRTRVAYTAKVDPSASNSDLSIHIRKNAANLVTEYWIWQQQILEDKVLPEIIKEAVKKKLQDDMEDMPELVLLEQVEKLDARMKEVDKRVWSALARSADPYKGEKYDPDTDINITRFYQTDPSDGTGVERRAIEDISKWLEKTTDWTRQKREFQELRVTKWFAPDAIVPPIEYITTVADARRVGQEVLGEMTEKMQRLEEKYDNMLTDGAALAKYLAESDNYALGSYHLRLTGTVQARQSGTTGDQKLTETWAGEYREERKTVRNDIWARNPGVTTPDATRNPTISAPSYTPQVLEDALEWSRQWAESIRQRFLENYFANLDATETHPYFPYLTRLRYQIRKLRNMSAGADEMTDAELAEALGRMKLEKTAVSFDPGKDKAATIAELRGKMEEEYKSIISNLFNLVGVELTVEQGDYKLLGKYKVSATTKVKDKPSLTAEEIGKFITGYRWTLVSNGEVVMNVTTRQPEIEITPIHAGFNHVQVEPVTSGGLPLGYVHQPIKVGELVVSGELEVNGSFKDPNATVEVLMGEDQRQLLTSSTSVVFDVQLDRVTFQDLLDLGIISKLPTGETTKRPFNFVA
ncbi:MAG TPA: hypothetical protein VJB15_10445, partial [Rhodothermia bacterium]|nr:hypothetical protein [Rhodothermia bacterium]